MPSTPAPLAQSGRQIRPCRPSTITPQSLGGEGLQASALRTGVVDNGISDRPGLTDRSWQTQDVHE